MSCRPMTICLTIALTLLTAACKKENEAAETIRPVLSMVAEPSAEAGGVAAGTIEPRYKADLSFRVLGRIVARPVNVGDLVQQGQVLAAIDSTALELAVRSAKAEVAKSEAQLTNATATEERKRALAVSDSSSKASLDNAEQTRAATQAALAQAQANLVKANEQLGYAQIKSEFSGVVTAVAAEVGQVVSPGQTVVTVARPDVREAVVDIGPDFPAELKVGLPFTVSLQLLPSVEVGGEIREVAPQADTITRTRRVRIALREPPASFRLGTTINAKLKDAEHMLLRLPASAVFTKDGRDFVWIVDPQNATVSLQKVLLEREQGSIIVRQGIPPGARVVTAGVHSLREGQKVRIEDTAR